MLHLELAGSWQELGSEREDQRVVGEQQLDLNLQRA